MDNNKKEKPTKEQPLKVNATLEELIKASVKGNPKPKKVNKKKD
ncbi:MAG: hypothetical protein WC389_15305 [Lutibacter sp.]|jgi:hypothetical protein